MVRFFRFLHLKMLSVVLVGSVGLASAMAGEYREHEQRLNSLASRIRQAEDKIYELIAQIEKTQDSHLKKQIVTEMKTTHAALENDSAAYQELRFHVRFKHPDKGDALNQKYRPYGLRSLEDMQEQKVKGFAGQLDKVVMKMKKIYGVSEQQKAGDDTESPPREPASESPTKYRLVK